MAGEGLAPIFGHRHVNGLAESSLKDADAFCKKVTRSIADSNYLASAHNSRVAQRVITWLRPISQAMGLASNFYLFN